MAPKVDSQVLHDTTMKERELTDELRPVKGGPTAQLQKHVGEEIDGKVVFDVAQGEKKVTYQDTPVAGGPAATLQGLMILQGGPTTEEHTGKLDSKTISAISSAEKDITGSDTVVKGGPTAMAQKHAGEDITSQALHDITEGEKKVTDGERIKGGPTSVAQSEVAKSN